MRKINRIITLSILVTMISSFSFGCGNDTPGGDETTAATETPTTTKVEDTTVQTETPTTTPEPPTTEEPTTEEPTTEYVWKGEKFIINASKKDIFTDLIVEKGYKIALNDLVGKNEGDDADRGGIGRKLTLALYRKNHIDKADEFVYTYLEGGADLIEISYDQNVIIEYNEREKMFFYFVKEKNGKAYFDVYEIN